MQLNIMHYPTKNLITVITCLYLHATPAQCGFNRVFGYHPALPSKSYVVRSRLQCALLSDENNLYAAFTYLEINSTCIAYEMDTKIDTIYLHPETEMHSYVKGRYQNNALISLWTSKLKLAPGAIFVKTYYLKNSFSIDVIGCSFYVLTMRCEHGIYKLQRHLTLSNMVELDLFDVDTRGKY